MTAAPIYIVSGGTGASGELLVRTALAQFEGADPPLIVVPHVRRSKALAEIVEQVVCDGGIIVHTLVDATLRDDIVAIAERSGVPAVDLIGPVIDHLAELLRQEPLEKPGRYRQLREDYFRRIEAIDFAVNHDDGSNLHNLRNAEVVLTGVSRSGKTPLCMYLAMRGWKAANVPLVQGVEPPAELFEVDRKRVFGLILDVDELIAHREVRQRRMGIPTATAYMDPRAIVEELEFARRIYRRGRFKTIDITHKPLEESAGEVMASLPPRAMTE